uniref:TMV resistance protein N n=1 Tax=Noccaea caerulescens TaxID=107243 RepID=A0A1J3GCI3_NOCCA
MASSSASRVSKYDVFLSFRGEDTRHSIVSHLYEALARRGLVTFKDDKRLEIGDHISDELQRAIQGSDFAVVVLSENYATSRWCLMELQLIMELQRQERLCVVPVFYGVKPSAVRHQQGSFDLERYNRPETADKVLSWRQALNRIACISGLDSRFCDEASLVGKIADFVSRSKTLMHSIDSSNIVGGDTHMEGLKSLLDMDSENEEVRMIGIWGMGGIGKTTIAKFLYEEYSRRFAHYCFIENVRIFAKKGLPYLQEKLLSELRGKKQDKLWSVEKGRSRIKSKLKGKIFLVLDDVDDVDQLRALAKKTWFGPGSRIIITTRDFGLLYSFGVRLVYHVSFLDNNDAIQLFKQVAFEGGQAPDDIYQQFSIRASRLAQGLPSALEAFGKHLSQITWREGWEQALGILETVPQRRIKDILKTSYEGLDEEEQAAFLHVACLFNGESVHRVNTLIDDGDIRIKTLEVKSLIDISPDRCITMHVLIEQAAREIVRQESRSMHWRQRILWKTDPIIFVLHKNTVSVIKLLDLMLYLALISKAFGHVYIVSCQLTLAILKSGSCNG